MLLYNATGIVQLVLVHKDIDIPDRPKLGMRIEIRNAGALEDGTGNLVRFQQIEDSPLLLQHGFRSRRNGNRRAAHLVENYFRHAVHRPNRRVQQRRYLVPFGLFKDCRPIHR